MAALRILCFALCLILSLPLLMAQENCERKDKTPGHCVNWRKCSQFKSVQNVKNMTDKQKNYLRNGLHICARTTDVCCEDSAPKSPGLQLLEQQDCGLFEPTPQTALGHFLKIGSRPWMALLKYNESMTCGGTLITNRFVLTAAHCVKDQKLTSVVLGEHIRNSVKDCNRHKNRIVCSDPIEEFNIERVFVHENSKRQQHDIALIKLARAVVIKSHIKPICLPLTNELQEPESTKSLYVTGWGVTERGRESAELRESYIYKVPRSDCIAALNNTRGFDMTAIDSNIICAGDTRGDSCKGDSGGPLSYVTYIQGRQRFVQCGIVSYGYDSCYRGTPSVYTNVGKYIQWIAEKLVAT